MADLMSLLLAREDVTQADFDRACQAARDGMISAGKPDAEVADFDRQWKGGACPQCGAAYRKVEVNETATPRWKEDQQEKSAKVTYSFYEPSCDCHGDVDTKHQEESETRSRLAAAGIPAAYRQSTFQQWDHDHASHSASRAMAETRQWLESGEWQNRGLVCYGDVGTGKTHCAIALLRSLIGPRMTGRFVVMADLVQGLIKGTYDTEDLAGAGVVVFDDMDKLAKTDNAWVTERVFSIFDVRVREDKVLIATSNLKEPADFQEQFGEAVASRLFGRCRFVKFEGSDYRLIRRGLEKGEPELWT